MSGPHDPLLDPDHWTNWHEHYEDPSSSLSERLDVVRRRLCSALDECAPGLIRLASMCAGEGRDVLGVLRDHPRRHDVRALLVELDPVLAQRAATTARELGLSDVEVHCADASLVAAYGEVAPCDVLLVCGVFGNISDEDIDGTIRTLPALVAPRATVLWTRHRTAPDVTPKIRQWFLEAGFVEVAFDTAPNRGYAVGTARYDGATDPSAASSAPMFRFVKTVS